MPDVAIVVPWAGGCEHREAARDWVERSYKQAFPAWPVLVGVGERESWAKAAAVSDALKRCDAETVVIADADVWCDEIAAAVNAVRSGAQWAVPHMLVNRLDETSTASLIVGRAYRPTLTQRPYRGVLGGGIAVLSAQTARDVPLDPRFRGWGQEDESWGLALLTMLGRPWRGNAPLIHLHHPPQPRLTRRKGSASNWQLYQRYRAARRDKPAMTALLEEARNALQSHQPRMHTDPAIR